MVMMRSQAAIKLSSNLSALMCLCACELQAKFRHFDKVDAAKFSELWHLQQAEAGELTRQLLAADRVVTEQQLGWKWKGPDDTLFISPHDLSSGPAVTASKVTAAAAAAGGGGGGGCCVNRGSSLKGPRGTASAGSSGAGAADGSLAGEGGGGDREEDCEGGTAASAVIEETGPADEGLGGTCNEGGGEGEVAGTSGQDDVEAAGTTTGRRLDGAAEVRKKLGRGA
jgi:hypothetical protein